MPASSGKVAAKESPWPVPAEAPTAKSAPSLMTRVAMERSKETLGKLAEVAGDSGGGGERIVGILGMVGDGLGKGDKRVGVADLGQEDRDCQP